jgi:hypothetical protein
MDWNILTPQLESGTRFWAFMVIISMIPLFAGLPIVHKLWLLIEKIQVHERSSLST